MTKVTRLKMMNFTSVEYVFIVILKRSNFIKYEETECIHEKNLMEHLFFCDAMPKIMHRRSPRVMNKNPRQIIS